MKPATNTNLNPGNLEDFQNPTVFAEAGVESWTDALIVTDKRGNVCYINPAAERLTGYSIVEMRNKPLASFVKMVNESDRNHPKDPIAQCIYLNRRVTFGNQDILINREGKEIAIGGRSAPIRQPAGVTVGAALKIRDVTSTRLMVQRIFY